MIEANASGLPQRRFWLRPPMVWGLLLALCFVGGVIAWIIWDPFGAKDVEKQPPLVANPKEPPEIEELVNNPSTLDVEKPTTLEPENGSTDNLARLRVVTHGTMLVWWETEVWENGQFKWFSGGGGGGGTHLNPGVIALDIVGRAWPRVSLPDVGNFTVYTQTPLAVPGAIRAIGLPKKVDVQDGDRVAVLAFIAAQRAEAGGAVKSLEELLRTQEWALVLMLKFKRRNDSHGFDLRVDVKDETENGFLEVLRYSGPSLGNAVEEGRSVFLGDSRTQALAKAVAVDATNPKRGTITPTSIYVRGGHAGVLLKTGLPAFSVEYESGWELTAESRLTMKKLLKLP